VTALWDCASVGVGQLFHGRSGRVGSDPGGLLLWWRLRVYRRGSRRSEPKWPVTPLTTNVAPIGRATASASCSSRRTIGRTRPGQAIRAA